MTFSKINFAWSFFKNILLDFFLFKWVKKTRNACHNVVYHAVVKRERIGGGKRAMIIDDIYERVSTECAIYLYARFRMAQLFSTRPFHVENSIPCQPPQIRLHACPRKTRYSLLSNQMVLTNVVLVKNTDLEFYKNKTNKNQFEVMLCHAMRPFCYKF